MDIIHLFSRSRPQACKSGSGRGELGKCFLTINTALSAAARFGTVSDVSLVRAVKAKWIDAKRTGGVGWGRGRGSGGNWKKEKKKKKIKGCSAEGSVRRSLHFQTFISPSNGGALTGYGPRKMFQVVE